MEYVHVRNLEKYHPGYKDRTLQWAKIYINMAEGDPDTELIDNEIDWGRLIKIILLELRAQKPLPNIDSYWAKKGFDTKKRPMSLTIQMLHNFLVINTEDSTLRYVEKSKSKIREDKEEEKSKIYVDFEKSTLQNWNSFCQKFPVLSSIKEMTGKRRDKLKKRFEKESFRDFNAILESMKDQTFLFGENNHKWRVSFDWIIENDTNYIKILEKKYLNHETESDQIKLKEKYKL
jgi:hypothetical protein